MPPGFPESVSAWLTAPRQTGGSPAAAPGGNVRPGGLILAMLIRIAEGRFRVWHRLLTQIGRVMMINRTDRVTSPVVEAARESLVIGTA
jgi:hypothetical protein